MLPSPKKHRLPLEVMLPGLENAWFTGYWVALKSFQLCALYLVIFIMLQIKAEKKVTEYLIIYLKIVYEK